MSTDQVANREFEDRVREIARTLWPSSAYCGATMYAGLERDGVFETPDMVHIVEATTSRRKDPIVHNATKTADLIRDLRPNHPDQIRKGWLVTLHEPTAEQRSALNSVLKRRKNVNIVICSYSQFQARLVDASAYLSLRDNYRFGSARNLRVLNDFKNVGDYIEMDIIETNPQSKNATSESWSVNAIIDLILNHRKTIVLVGDFGSGKSMTLREIFLRLRKTYFADTTRPFPVYLNLRDHWAQQNPVEALERHAREIGYPDERQLVMAWRAGFISLILDGFDEVAAAGWGGSGERLVQLRQRAMIMIRKFVAESPSQMTLIIAGRSHYFDSEGELERALGTGRDALYLTLNDFSAEQVASYLRKQGYEGQIPDWLPSRPLLIGHLAQRGMLQGLITADNSELSAAQGWRLLRTMICEREASIEEANILADQLQRVLERVATIARSQADGLGPIQSTAIFCAFRQVMGQPPDDAAQVLLLRLPGLGAYSGSDTGSRSFVDEDLADVFRSGDVVSFAEQPYESALSELRSAIKLLGNLGVAVAALDCSGTKRVAAALLEASRHDGAGVLAFDIYRLMCAKGLDYEGKKADIREVIVEEMEVGSDMPSMRGVSFYNCLVGQLYIEEDVNGQKCPRLVNCDIDEVVGRVGFRDLPEGLLDASCTVKDFTAFDRTTRSIMRATLPVGVKVMLTILKKLFLQAGSGRQERALYRGLRQEARNLVGPILDIVESEGLARAVLLDRRKVWIPARTQYGRVLKILEAPSESTDELVERCGNWTGGLEVGPGQGPRSRGGRKKGELAVNQFTASSGDVV